MIEWILSLIVGSIASVVAVSIFRVYYRKRKAHHLMWCVGLALWGISAFAQGYAALAGWPVPLYRLYYFSAISLAGFLGAGTLGLIVSSQRMVFKGFSGYIVFITAVLGIAVSVATVDLEVLKDVVVGGLALPSNVRLIAPFINIPGGVTFIGGAAYSLVRTKKVYALLITLGASVPAIGGILARFAIPGFLPFTDFFGILFLTLGIYVSTKVVVGEEIPRASLASKVPLAQ